MFFCQLKITEGTAQVLDNADHLPIIHQTEVSLSRSDVVLVEKDGHVHVFISRSLDSCKDLDNEDARRQFVI